MTQPNVLMTSDHAVRLIQQHIPSLSDADEDTITTRVARFTAEAFTGRPGSTDVADLAVRTCACGAAIDGFYGYVDHLLAVFGRETHYGG